LVSVNARKQTENIYFGTRSEYYKQLIFEQLATLKGSDYKGERVIIKGCSDKEIPVSAYVELTKKLQPFAQSIMFGEACSNVPIFKRPRELKK